MSDDYPQNMLEEVVTSLQRELELTKKTRDNNAMFATTEKQWREQAESKLAASEANNKTLESLLETANKRALEATKDVVASEAKVERMKELVCKLHWLHASTPAPLIEAMKGAGKCGMCGPVINEPPSTSLDLYHKERNKKELGEVLRLLDSIMCDPEGNCAIYGSDEDRKIGQEALSILKRLTE